MRFQPLGLRGELLLAVRRGSPTPAQLRSGRPGSLGTSHPRSLGDGWMDIEALAEAERLRASLRSVQTPWHLLLSHGQAAHVNPL